VYRARDTRLDRHVAIKSLPDALRADSERAARFEREAKLLASLNHPNIATIYGLEHVNGEQFIVMELVEGETLADRIARGPVPVPEALEIAKHIAEALEAAHEHGVIHRDLKPANVKFTAVDRVKVLDFGLAKALAPNDASSSHAVLTNSPTLTSPIAVTGVGALLGTAAYMSPERARGKAVDKRSDIWAFGCVLYEMLTGRRAFDHGDVTDTLASSVRGEPDWNVVPPAPHGVRATLKACLRKDLRDRIRDIADVRLALDGAFAEASATPLPARTARTWRRVAPWGLAIVVSGLAIAASWWQSGAMLRPRIVRFTIPFQSSVTQRGNALAISPDGSEIVYSAPGDGPLYAHALDQLAPTAIRGTERAVLAFFGQDGKALAFSRVFGGAPQLWTVPKQGGTATHVCDCGPGAAWLSPDTLVTSGPSGELVRVSAGGASLDPLTTRTQGELRHLLPSLLPGGNLLFTILSGSPDTAQIAGLRIQSKERVPLLQGLRAVYTRSGHLVVARADGSLWATPFDPDRIALNGEPVCVEIQLDLATFTISENGTLTYLPSAGALGRLVWVDRNGQESNVVDDRGIYRGPRISPDGSQLAVASGTDGLSDSDADPRGEAVWVLDIARGTRHRLAYPGVSLYPLWTPDGQRITFAAATSFSLTNDQFSIYSRLADGTGNVELLWKQVEAVVPSSWTRNGDTLAFWSLRVPERDRSVERAPTEDRNILRMKAGEQPEPLVAGPYSERAARFSPDGRWIAYVSNESGPDEIYVQPYPSNTPRQVVSSGGGTEPVWSADSRELFYRPLDGDGLMVVPFDGQPQRARRLFNGLFRRDEVGIANYDVTPDGKRFIMVKPAERASHLIVVLTWFEDLKRLVPTN
jgi:serine/threonine protein kinase/Tol biopolymer transport system component